MTPSRIAAARSRMEVSNSHTTNVPKKTLDSIAPHHATEPGGQQGTTTGASMKKAITKRISVASPKIRDGIQNECHLSSRLKALESSQAVDQRRGRGDLFLEDGFERSNIRSITEYPTKYPTDAKEPEQYRSCLQGP